MNSKRYLRKISHNYVVEVNFPTSFWSQVFFVSSKQGYFTSNSKEAMLAEMEFIHLLRRYFLTPFWLFILCAKMRVRHGSICANKSTFDYFDGTNPISGQGIPLRSPTPIMAPGPLITIAKVFVCFFDFFSLYFQVLLLHPVSSPALIASTGLS